MKQPPVETRF